MRLEKGKIGVYIIIIAIAVVFFTLGSAFSVEKITVSSPKKQVFVGETIDLKIEIYLNGSTERLIIYPPKLDSLDGVEVQNVAGTSTSSDGQVIQSYNYKLKMNKIGEVSFDPIVISYKDKTSDTEKKMQGKGITINVEKFSLLKSNAAKAFIVGAFTLTVFIVLMFITNKKTKKSITEVKSDSKLAGEILLNIKKAKLDGNSPSFFDEVIKLMDLLNEHDDEYTNYVKLREKARFSGSKFQQEDISTIYKLMENKVKARFKNDMKDELAGIEFEG